MNKLYLIISELENKLSEKRFKHTLGVVETAVRLAKKYGIDTEKARLAALLHDCAKGLKIEELLELAKKSDWEIDEWEYKLKRVLYAPVAAYLAKIKWNIKDREILEAIRYHTLGHPDMGLLAKIIFVADFIEPNRKFKGLDKIRSKAEVDLNKTIISICDYSLTYNIGKKQLIHPNTLYLRNILLGGKK